MTLENILSGRRCAAHVHLTAEEFINYMIPDEMLYEDEDED